MCESALPIADELEAARIHEMAREFRRSVEAALPEDEPDLISTWVYDLLAAKAIGHIHAARVSAREEAARIAENPYSDAVQVVGPEEPFAVGRKIAAAIRALAPEPRQR